MQGTEGDNDDLPMDAPAAAVTQSVDLRGCVVGLEEFELAYDALRRSAASSPVCIFPSCDTDSLCALSIFTVPCSHLILRGLTL